jgi:hypothetical protein
MSTRNPDAGLFVITAMISATPNGRTERYWLRVRPSFDGDGTFVYAWTREALTATVYRSRAAAQSVAAVRHGELQVVSISDRRSGQ